MTLKAIKKKLNEQYLEAQPLGKPDKGKKRYLNRKVEELEAESEIKEYQTQRQLDLFPELNEHPRGTDR